MVSQGDKKTVYCPVRGGDVEIDGYGCDNVCVIRFNGLCPRGYKKK